MNFWRLGYQAFRNYVTFFFRLYYPKMHVVGKANVPPNGSPVILAGCHQNCLIDVLAATIAIDDRRTREVVRADVFKNPIAAWFLGKLGLIPVARMNFEGEEAMEKFNKQSLRKVSDALCDGHAVMIFPESGHQQGRYLGNFSLAYLRMAFGAAERMNFEKEVYVEPFAHHYAHYHHPFYDMMIMFGEPLKLSPYYERYKTKPLTVQREVNAIVRERIRQMMLNVDDKEHYADIDFLRKTTLGNLHAEQQGHDRSDLTAKLASDKLFCARQAEAGEDYWQRVSAYREKLKGLKLRDWVVNVKHLAWQLLYRVFFMLLWLVPALVSMIVTLPATAIPVYLKNKKINGTYDPMFGSTFDVGATVLLTIPVFCLLPSLVLLCCGQWWALLAPAIYVLMLLGACHYQRLAVKTLGLLRALAHPAAMKELRGESAWIVANNPALKA